MRTSPTPRSQRCCGRWRGVDSLPIARSGRSFVYRAKVASDAVSRSMIDHLVDRMFEGNLTAAVNHLLTTRDEPGGIEGTRAAYRGEEKAK